MFDTANLQQGVPMSRTVLSGLIGLASVLMLAETAAAAPSITGVWARGDGNARVKIEPCGEHYCATNIWVKPGRKGESVGDTLVMMVEPKSDAELSGKAYDRRRKLTFSMDIAVKPSLLTSRGCMLGGLACTSMNWTRLD